MVLVFSAMVPLRVVLLVPRMGQLVVVPLVAVAAPLVCVVFNPLLELLHSKV